ncbi:sensor histidine kinase [Shinella pollutisoli]|uniref:histidine kinase n=1 Tax=Shinella pollutisoli TaxID=2250594 RepID=A0ABV7DDT6_9HYPH|nr:PAS domain-containing sensor histidine kinase [Shinella pollutisoli]
MSAKQYPFIDVAVHERVRAPFARGEAVVLFSRDMARVLWSNGRGAALFGHDSIYDFLDAGPDTGDVAFRQLSATARQAQAPGERRTLLMRIGSGFRSVPVNATVECVTIRPGDEAILFSAPVAAESLTRETVARAMLSGFDDPDTHMAVLDGEGGIIAASEGFDSLAITPETRRMLVNAAGRSADWLVKRPIPTGLGHLPAAIGRVAADPALHLLFAVETILGHLDPDGDEEESAPAAEDETADADAVPAEAEAAAEEIAPAGEFEPIEEKAPADDVDEPAKENAEYAVEPEEPAAEESVAEHAAPPVAAGGFAFNRQGRPVRFVWKIDAEGRFSEISEEFAMAVGPHAAAIAGERFVDVATRFGLDPDGKIADLLGRRDTWSGKTILWPVEGTNLAVPVDLAALPTYSRNRDFDGFRGFGIVRIADAVEDPAAHGLALGETDEPAGETAATPDDGPAAEPAAGHAPEAETGPSPAEPDGSEQDAFRGERPALRLVETPVRRQSDKIVQLEARRGRGIFEGLSSGEQAAFREIARQLGETFGKRKPEDLPPSEETTEEAGTPLDAETEMPGLEVGPHADDLPPESMAEERNDDRSDERTAIAPPRTQMDYGLTATVVDALPVALLVHVGDRLIHANPEFFRLTGYTTLEDLEASGGLDVLLDGPAAGEGGGTIALRHADGESTSPVTARLQSIRWEDGSALMLALTPAPEKAAEPPAEPETAAEERNAEQAALSALRIEAGELRSILETATDGVVVVGQDGIIRSMNRSASALFNYDEEEIRGRPFALLFAHESQKAVLDYLSGLSGHGVASVLNDGREVIGREASGGFIPLFMTMGRLSSSSGYCAVIRDITQWKRTEEELRNAKRAAETANAHKSDFLARVSHEIRTPLNAIIGFSDMMATERFGPIGHPRYVEYANDIGRSGRHVLDIVNDLLDISKIEAGEMDLDFTAVGLNETVSEAVSLVQPQANAQRVIIRTSLAGNVPQVVADLRSIKQIALNILSNAIRFTPSGGQIVVSTAYEANGSVVLRIRDTGIGMTRSELEQAMKPFRQVTTGTTRKRGDGTGLGLPLTKAMVDANRATFSISSTPNEGTLVEVTFPSPRVLAD